jgi:hypothetical protein
MFRWILATLFLLIAAPALSQPQAPSQGRNPLLTGKLIYVAPMPQGLDAWIIDDLRQWGKYQVTANPEGVNLILRSYKPEKETQWGKRDGVPVPKGEDRRTPLSRKKTELPAVSFTVINWVTDQPLWHVDILNRKQKKDEPDPPAGPETEIYARDMTPDQIAQRVATRLREYVTELEKKEGAKKP